VYYVIYKKLLFYIEIRNCFFVLSERQYLEFATTILITDIPKKNLYILKNIYSIFSEEVCSIKINRDLFSLSKKITKRQKLICVYKTAVIEIIQSVIYSCCQKRISNWYWIRITAFKNKSQINNILLTCICSESVYFYANKKFSNFLFSAKFNNKNKCLQKLTILNKNI